MVENLQLLRGEKLLVHASPKVWMRRCICRRLLSMSRLSSRCLKRKTDYSYSSFIQDTVVIVLTSIKVCQVLFINKLYMCYTCLDRLKSNFLTVNAVQKNAFSARMSSAYIFFAGTQLPFIRYLRRTGSIVHSYIRYLYTSRMFLIQLWGVFLWFSL